MARPLRIQFAGAWYHVMNRGAGRKNIFRSHKHFILFQDLLAEITERFSIEVHAYCLMTNHYHLLVHTPKANLSRAVRHLNGVYTQRFNKDVGTDGPLFRGRYKSILVDSDEHLIHLSRYIHLNPIEAGIVVKPEDYLWSSYSSYVEIRETPDWLYCDEILSRVSPSNKILRYQQFVNEGVNDNICNLLSKEKMPAVLGSMFFIESIKNEIIDQVPASSDISESKQLHKHLTVSLNTIIDYVAQYYSVLPQAIKKRGNRKKPNILRNMVITIAALYADYSYREIATAIGSGSYHSVSNAVKRFRKQSSQDGLLYSDYKKIVHRIFSDKD